MKMCLVSQQTISTYDPYRRIEGGGWHAGWQSLLLNDNTVANSVADPLDTSGCDLSQTSLSWWFTIRPLQQPQSCLFSGWLRHRIECDGKHAACWLVVCECHRAVVHLDQRINKIQPDPGAGAL